MRGHCLRKGGRRSVTVAVAAALVLAAPAWSTQTAAATLAAVTGSPHGTAAPSSQPDGLQGARRGWPSKDGERVTSGLEVTVEQVSPASLTPGTPVQISGTVTNLDPERWEALQAYLVVDTAAITTPEQLAAALASPLDTFNGERICCDERFYDDILDSLAPGESTTYSLAVPFGQLGLAGAASGVYTVSVQVLGERVDQGRVDGYDGRTRILMPYLSEADDPTPMAVVIPLHYPLRRLPDGTFDDVDDLVDSISSGGPLRNRLDLIAASQSGQATLLVDPALLDALRAVADDQFGPAGGGGDGDETEAQRAAAEFLDRLELAATRSDVLVEPYGRADLTALARHPEYRLERMVRQVGERALDTGSISGTPAYQPEGPLDAAALAAIARRRLVLVDSNQVAGWTPADGAVVERLVDDEASAPVIVAETSLTAGGMAPGPSDSALHVRQRLLAESAVLSLAGDGAGLVFVPDDDWDPGPGSVGDELFDQLDTPWVAPTPLGALTGSDRDRAISAAEPEGLDAEPLPAYVLSAAARLRRRATTLEGITGPDSALQYYLQTAALAVSATLRSTPDTAAELADENVATIDKQLDRISVEGPQAVTLSSNSGRFPITLTNRLDQPVTVGAVIYDEEGMLGVENIAPQEIAPGSQLTVDVSVDAPDVGVTTVNVRLNTEGGRQFGQPVTFPLRSSVLGEIIWYAMGAVGAFLLLLVVRRAGRRLRTKAPVPEPAP